MTIYALIHDDDIGQCSEEYVTDEADIERLALDHYWGAQTLRPAKRFSVTVNMIENTVILVDLENRSRCIMYDILEFEQKKIFELDKNVIPYSFEDAKVPGRVEWGN